ncbi:hypothetical protein M011DRAFT_469832 [Sporormia fimetaria CBS 119925]|uniref:Uncharacterized protein n=1 Tax=Sporormia fimetaria CBS 119925 TaxID=1340428 RepID=A0A6A6V3G7_9PLEO|nr:hypothetical protein M011DRAFT_469832 [Sporormia fimetaria CBS 119925]
MKLTSILILALAGLITAAPGADNANNANSIAEANVAEAVNNIGALDVNDLDLSKRQNDDPHHDYRCHDCAVHWKKCWDKCWKQPDCAKKCACETAMKPVPPFMLCSGLCGWRC